VSYPQFQSYQALHAIKLYEPRLPKMPLSVGLEQLLMLMLIDSLWHRTKRAPSAMVYPTTF